MFKNLNPLAIGVSGHQSEIIELALTYGFAGMDLNMAEFASRARLKGMPYAKRLIQSAKIRIGTFPLPIGLGHRRRGLSERSEEAAGTGRLRRRNWAAPAARPRLPPPATLGLTTRTSSSTADAFTTSAPC